MNTAIYDQINALQDTISKTEEELEAIITNIKGVQREAERHLEAAASLYKQSTGTEDATVLALQRRAENLKDLATKMVSMTMRF